MYMLVVRCGQLHGAAHARTGELRGLASWQASRDWRQPACLDVCYTSIHTFVLCE